MSCSSGKSSAAGAVPSRPGLRGGMRRSSLIEFASAASAPQHSHVRAFSSSRVPHALQNLMERSTMLRSTPGSGGPAPALLWGA